MGGQGGIERDRRAKGTGGEEAETQGRDLVENADTSLNQINFEGT